MSRILIQPTISVFDEYFEFANRNDLLFEIADFASPRMRADESAEILDCYEKQRDKSKFLSLHGAFVDLFINSPDHAIQHVSKKKIIQNIEASEKLGVEFVVFHSNCLPMMGSPTYYERWVREHIKFWSEVTDKYKVTILLENMWDKTPELIAQVVQAVKSPRLKVCLDTGHHRVFSQATLEEWFARLGDQIVYLHLADNKGDRDSELVLGEGTVEWLKLTSLIEHYCDNPLAVIETRNLEMIEASLRYLQNARIYPYAR